MRRGRSLLSRHPKSLSREWTQLAARVLNMSQRRLLPTIAQTSDSCTTAAFWKIAHLVVRHGNGKKDGNKVVNIGLNADTHVRSGPLGLVAVVITVITHVISAKMAWLTKLTLKVRHSEEMRSKEKNRSADLIHRIKELESIMFPHR